MGSLTSLNNPSSLILADTSTLINLDASGYAAEIIQAIPNKIALAKHVRAELEEGRAKGKMIRASILKIVESGEIETLEMGEAAAKIFEELVVGEAVSTLDDGEAATIALAAEHKGTALIDERKATRICGERYPALPVACTLDLFAHPEPHKLLGQAKMVEALENALRIGRMNVPQRYIGWVLNVVGVEKATTLNSLPKSARIR
jgi:predicted nucleic acid-binding protein